MYHHHVVIRVKRVFFLILMQEIGVRLEVVILGNCMSRSRTLMQPIVLHDI